MFVVLWVEDVPGFPDLDDKLDIFMSSVSLPAIILKVFNSGVAEGNWFDNFDLYFNLNLIQITIISK